MLFALYFLHKPYDASDHLPAGAAALIYLSAA
jgi:hypothetical protein